jgi:carboxybiotin decarboxylase
MPGGAIGPNVHMMKEAGILDRYGEVLAEFPVVVKAGGAWTSVTPGSQQYWLQAFNNVLHGRWKKIDPGYGRSVLGYFGRPPEPPDPEVVEDRGRAAQAEARSRATRSTSGARQPRARRGGARGARPAAHRGERLPGRVGHRARQGHGPQRGHPLPDRQGAREPAVLSLDWQSLAMFGVGGVLIYLAIRKNYEPLLLIPIGFGAILANLPLAELSSSSGWHAEAGGKAPLLQLIYNAGIKTELLPPIIFLGVGALTDFRPLLGRPITFLLGAAAQLGIVIAALGAHYLFDFSLKEAGSIGIIGGADGPTSIFLTAKLAPHLLGPIAVAAYSYMSLVPVIQPPIMRLLTTKEERFIRMRQARPVSQTAVVVFPILVTILSVLAVPSCAPLVGMLMFGNLLRESGVTERLSSTAGGVLINIVTIFLGLTVGSTMSGEAFLTRQTLFILVLGAVAFAFSTVGGVLFAKFLNLFLRGDERINPCIGAAGVSAVPMSARVVQKFVSEETNGQVNPLMAAMGPNVAGVIGSAVAAGVFLALLG